MSSSKYSVDKYVRNMEKQIDDENKRKAMGLEFAKMYKKVGELELARQYISGYLSVKESSVEGHRLAGLIFEAQSNKEAALRSFQRSFDLDSNQRDLVAKICTLLASCPNSPATKLSKTWLPQVTTHSVLLKEQFALLPIRQETGPLDDSFENTVNKASDMNVRILLLEQYLASNRVCQAYDIVASVEANYTYRSELDWYGCALNVLEAYRMKTGALKLGKPSFHLQYLNALERYSFLKIANIQSGNVMSLHQSLAPIMSTLSRLNEGLKSAVESNCVDSQVICHFTCQVYFLMGLISLAKTRQGFLNERECLGHVVALFALAYHHQNDITIGEQSMEVTDRKMIEAYRTSAIYRQSQCGHCVLAWANQRGRQWAVESIRKLDTIQGKRHFFDTFFGTTHRFPLFTETCDAVKTQFDLPVLADLMVIDRLAMEAQQYDLHHLVWLGARYLAVNPSTSFIHLLPNIPLDSLAAEILSLLDIEAFIYAAIYSAGSGMVSIFPVLLNPRTCSSEQLIWWEAVIKLINRRSKELRRIVEDGLKVIRFNSPDHGIHEELAAKVARSFAARAFLAQSFPTVHVPAAINTNILTAQQTVALIVQACHYWKYFLYLNASSSSSSKLAATQRMFDYRQSLEMNTDALVAEGRLYVGYHSWRAGRKNEAQLLLRGSSDPYASYYQALIFQESAEVELKNGSQMSADIMLKQYRSALLVTRYRLESDVMASFHPLDEILNKLIKGVEFESEALINPFDIIDINGQSCDSFHFGEEEVGEHLPWESITPATVSNHKDNKSTVEHSDEPLAHDQLLNRVTSSEGKDFELLMQELNTTKDQKQQDNDAVDTSEISRLAMLDPLHVEARKWQQNLHSFVVLGDVDWDVHVPRAVYLEARKPTVQKISAPLVICRKKITTSRVTQQSLLTLNLKKSETLI